MATPRARSLSEDALLPFLQRQQRGSLLLKPPPVGPPLMEILRLTARLLPCRSGAVFLDDPTIKRAQGSSPLTVVAAFGLGASRRLGAQLAPQEGLASEVYSHGRMLNGVFPNPTRVVEPIERAAEQRQSTVLGAPIRLGNQVCGVIELIHIRPGARFTRREGEIAELVARSVSNILSGTMDALRRNELVMEDDLTGLLNSRSLEPTLRREIAQTRRAGGDLAVLFCDLDYLKSINDRFGHRMGSRAIQRVGHALRRSLKGYRLLYRFGGDEFVVILRDIDTPEVALAHAERVRNAIEAIVLPRSPGTDRAATEPVLVRPTLSASIGVATYRQLDRSVSSGTPRNRRTTTEQLAARLLNAADRALYRAKRAGRNCVAMAEPADFTRALP